MNWFLIVFGAVVIIGGFALLWLFIQRTGTRDMPHLTVWCGIIGIAVGAIFLMLGFGK